MSSPLPSISPIEEIVADLREGKMVILVDEEDRENEGDLVLAADHVTPQAINFMAKFGRGLVCLTLTKGRCEHLGLLAMTPKNESKTGTAFTVSIEAATGVTTGISAADRARTVQAAVATTATAQDIVQPGHIFPLQAVDGGVLIRAGHTEAGCDLAAMAGCTPAAVICEIMKDDGEMARLPDLLPFAAAHGLKIGTIVELIAYRSRTESLIERRHHRTLQTPWGVFDVQAYTDKATGDTHLAFIKGTWDTQHGRQHDSVLVRVQPSVSIFDALDMARRPQSWTLSSALRRINAEGRGVLVLLHTGESTAQVMQHFISGNANTGAMQPLPPNHQGGSNSSPTAAVNLRTYGIGAQILRDVGVHQMTLMGTPLRMPSMAGFGLEVTGYLPKQETKE